MSPEGMEKYRYLMEVVKLRVALIDRIVNGKCSLEDVPQVECTALQFRKVLELIAFGSLVANEKSYKNAYSDFAKEWSAKKLLKKLRGLNPNFYPVPVSQVVANDLGGPIRHVKRVGYLTEEQFIDVYQQCSEIIHTLNPYSDKKQFNSADCLKSFKQWRTQIVTLLNLHELHLYKEPGMAFCSMNDGVTNKVRVYVAGPPPSSI